MNIRPIQQNDIESFCDAIGKVAEERKYILTTERPSFDNIHNWVMAYINDRYSHFVLEHQDQIIGWADITPLKRDSLAHVGQLGMGVISEFRSQGHGNQLLSSALDQAWSMGLKRIELEVFGNNKPAINLYKKHGFEIEGVKKNACFMRNEYLDIMCMAQLRF